MNVFLRPADVCRKERNNFPKNNPRGGHGHTNQQKTYYSAHLYVDHDCMANIIKTFTFIPENKIYIVS